MLDDFGNLTGGSEGNASKALEDLRNGTATWPWALAADRLEEAAFEDLQAQARAITEGAEAASGRERALAAALRIAVGRAGREETRRYLSAALDDLRAAVGHRTELDAVAAEIARLEVSYV
jgi:hypothetical protein